MIAQINTGRGFGGLVNYANDIAHKNTVIIASAGVSTTSNATIVASFKAQARMRPSLKNFVGHISLSFHPDDTPRLTNEFMAEVAQEYLRRRGIVNTQFVIFRHHDQPHGHVHIVYNRVDNDGNAIKGDCNFRASAAVTKALTREYGLTFGKGKRDVRRSHLKGRDAVKYQLYDTISALLRHCHNWQTLRTALAARGITMNLVQGDDGRFCGVTFTDNSHGVTLSGSKIDRSLSLVQLRTKLTFLPSFPIVMRPERKSVSRGACFMAAPLPTSGSTRLPHLHLLALMKWQAVPITKVHLSAAISLKLWQKLYSSQPLLLPQEVAVEAMTVVGMTRTRRRTRRNVTEE